MKRRAATQKRAPRGRKPKPSPEQVRAAEQALQLLEVQAGIQALRQRLLNGDCPATITEGERRAAAVDLERALAQLGNLQAHYQAGHRKPA